jgi:hypothetical protein
MRHVCFTLLVALAATLLSQAQIQAPSQPPQTARQALIEMFLGKTSGAFEKHLPEIARQAFLRKGETPENSLIQKISMAGRQFAAGEHVETFDEGSTLLVSEQVRNHQKTEIVIEHDYLMAEQDEIEVSIHVYRNGEPEFLYVIPRLIFSMIQEKEIWCLNEVTVAAHMPLTDPDYLKGVRKKADEVNENMAGGRVNMIASAELNYASNHPDRGYTCKLTELYGQAEAASAGAELTEGSSADLSRDESSGYHFSLSGCKGNPASKFNVTAVPTEYDLGMKSFCADQSGTVRFDASGNADACLSHGEVLNQAVTSVPAQVD